MLARPSSDGGRIEELTELRDTCIVTGNKLGSMGTPITQVYQGQEIKFCCKPCTKKFAANPGKYLAGL